MNDIKSRKNPLIVHLKKLGADGDYRRAAGEFLCDGEKLLYEAAESGADIRAVLISGEMPAWLPGRIPVYSVGQDIIDSVSPLKNAQNVIFSCAIPAFDDKTDLSGLTLILEGLQDPGNVGSILRTASAFGIGRVILIGACTDPYHPKTIRATMGAIFRQQLLVTGFDGVAALKSKEIRLYGAALGAGSKDIREVSLQNAAVVIGSEGRGLSDRMLELCDETIIIPMAPHSESLNAAAAAAIIMWEANKDHTGSR